MKKVLFIGKFNATMRSINEYLVQYFQMQLCNEDVDTIDGMIKLLSPDLILISLSEFGNKERAIYNKLANSYNNIPVQTVGTPEECARFKSFYETEQFENLNQPANSDDILNVVCNRLDESIELVSDIRNKSSNVKKHILVVDDNPLLLRNMKIMLEERYKISLATSGIQAMTSIGKSCPDLIILDYEMPVCDGRKTLEMIRADENLASIPVIFLTGIADKQYIESVLALKPHGYILKPPVKTRILREIESCLGEI